MSHSLVLEIKELFLRKKWKLAFAESCTGGLLSARVTALSGVSEFFVGSVISYANSVKEDVLGVEPELIKSVGAVSREVALAMAKGVRRRLNSDWAVAVTGIAGPSGGSAEKPVGTVWFGVSGPKLEWSERRVFQGTRQQIQESAVQQALELLKQHASQ